MKTNTFTENQLSAYNKMWDRIKEITEGIAPYKNHDEWFVDNDRMDWTFNKSQYDGTKGESLYISFYKDDCFPGTSGYKHWEIKGVASSNWKLNNSRLDYLKKKIDKCFNINIY